LPDIQQPVDPEARKKQIAMLIKWGAGIGVGLIASTFIFHALVGLIGLGLAFVITFGGIAVYQQLMPVFSMKLANWSMKLRINEAKANPIETMRNIYMQNMRIIEERKKKIVQFKARLDDYTGKMKQFKLDYPNEAESFEEVRQKMSLVLNNRIQKQRTAVAEAEAYEKSIERAEAIWDMSLAAKGLTELAAKDEQEVFRKILSKVSFDSVTHSFNTAVAELTIETDTDPSFDMPEIDAKKTPILSQIVTEHAASAPVQRTK
jgi:hypothetical protein